VRSATILSTTWENAQDLQIGRLKLVATYYNVIYSRLYIYLLFQEKDAVSQDIFFGKRLDICFLSACSNDIVSKIMPLGLKSGNFETTRFVRLVLFCSYLHFEICNIFY
jgi:hypothetical protein